MTSQLSYLIAQQRQAEFVSHAEDARPVSEEAPAYPPLCAHGMSSVSERGYALALGRLRRLTVERQPPILITSIESNVPCPHTCIADSWARSCPSCASMPPRR